MASSDSDMRRILESAGVENSIISNFEAQDITTEVVPTLSDAQLIQLGLTTLGKRQPIRSLCRNSSSGKVSSKLQNNLTRHLSTQVPIYNAETQTKRISLLFKVKSVQVW